MSDQEHEQEPKLHVDADWKAQVQAEKDRLASQEASRRDPADAPKGGEGLHVDADWKARAQAEKERLAQAAETAERQRPRSGELPKADFRTLVGVLASQAVMGLGAVGDPKTGRVVVDLPGAQFSIDLLGVLEEKTRGNLDDEEARELSQVLSELRSRYVQISNMIAQQATASPEAGPGSPPGGPPPR